MLLLCYLHSSKLLASTNTYNIAKCDSTHSGRVLDVVGLVEHRGWGCQEVTSTARCHVLCNMLLVHNIAVLYVQALSTWVEQCVQVELIVVFAMAYDAVARGVLVIVLRWGVRFDRCLVVVGEATCGLLHFVSVDASVCCERAAQDDVSVSNLLDADPCCFVLCCKLHLGNIQDLAEGHCDVAEHLLGLPRSF